uniref:PIH1 domain-containing protein 1 n=1 Tax=Cynoglossus semilaevis TaxID=244447 RepID=A0A3P8WFM0_CYNSE
MTTDSSLLNSELELQQQEELYQQLLLQVTARDRFLITFFSQTKEKIFVNICQSNSVPPPPDLSREELVELLQSEDPSGYRVPMSLGEPHSEVDNNSQCCSAYDVVINQEFFQSCQNDPLFQQFVILVSFEGLENKYNLELSRDWKVLKNRKFLGSISEQNIRTKSKPVIQEPVGGATATKAKRPEFTLLVEPPDGDPEYLIAEIRLPGVPSSGSLLLDLGEDRLVLTARPSLFHLDIFHPLQVDQENSVAQFNKSTELNSDSDDGPVEL